MGMMVHKKGTDNQPQVERIGGNNPHGGEEKDKYRKCKVKQETWGSKLQNKTSNYKNGNDDTRKKTTARNQSHNTKKVPWDWFSDRFSWLEEHVHALQTSSGKFHMASREFDPKGSVISHRCAQLGQTVVYHMQRLGPPHTPILTETSNCALLFPDWGFKYFQLYQTHILARSTSKTNTLPLLINNTLQTTSKGWKGNAAMYLFIFHYDT